MSMYKKSISRCTEGRIFYLIYTNPAAYPPLEHSSTILSNIGYLISFFGIGALGSADKMVFPENKKIIVRKLTYCPPGWRQKIHFLLFGLWSIMAAIIVRPKWIYASDLFSTPAALALSFLPGSKLIYHEHDYPTELEKEEIITKFTTGILWCRSQVAKRAFLCILPNQKRADIFRYETSTTQKVVCVWNCPRRDEVRAPKMGGRGNHPLRLAYHGSINSVRLPLTILDAMSKFIGRLTLSVVGYETIGSGNYMEYFLKHAEQLGLAESVDYVGTLATRQALLDAAASCDVGLAFMPIANAGVNHGNMAGASNKPFDFLACRLALLISDSPDWNDMFVDPGYAISCDPVDVKSLEAALQWFLENPEKVREMGFRGGERISSEWNYETQFQPVLCQMSQFSGQK
jgi:glycosyltransferase involved in cell wall biosynthesis